MNLDFGSILGRAWKITWEHKVLWIFGILASLGAGNGGGGGGSGYSWDGSDFGPGGQPQFLPDLERFFDRLFGRTEPAVIIAVVVGLICVALLISLVFLALSVIGRGGLIGGVQLADATGSVTFREAWGLGLRHFWTLFLIGLIVGLAILAMAVVTIGPGILLAVGTLGLGAICLIPLACVLAIAAIVLGIIGYFAQIAAVVEQLSVTDALRRAWEVIRANLGAIIILGIILAVVGGIVGFVIALPVIAIVIPPVFGLIMGGERAAVAGLVFAAVCFVAYLPVLLVLSGVLQTWTTAAWTLAYQELTGAAPVAPASPAAPEVLPS